MVMLLLWLNLLLPASANRLRSPGAGLRLLLIVATVSGILTLIATRSGRVVIISILLQPSIASSYHSLAIHGQRAIATVVRIAGKFASRIFSNFYIFFQT